MGLGYCFRTGGGNRMDSELIECKPNTEYATEHAIQGLWFGKDKKPVGHVYCIQMPTLSYRIHSPKDAYYLKITRGKQ